MRVLVTGAAGFIGSSVSEALLVRGDTVVGVDNFNAFYDPAIKEANVRAVEAVAAAEGQKFSSDSRRHRELSRFGHPLRGARDPAGRRVPSCGMGGRPPIDRQPDGVPKD